MVQFLLKASFFLLLTLLTQIGGLVYLISLLISRLFSKKSRFRPLLVFLVLYPLFTFLLVPNLAPFFGREKIKNTSTIKPTWAMTTILNRNYVTPELNQLLQKASKAMSAYNDKLEIRYLDACFPFWNGFPLLPHLSHNDGKKIDISFFYRTPEGTVTNKKKSISGYGVFSAPKQGEPDQIAICKANGYAQYDYPKYLTLGKVNSELVLAEEATRSLITILLRDDRLKKVFIEPHLKQRLRLTDSRVRYHGCRAVRHDDHIHLEVK
jgi:hypothetical protein